MLLLLELLLKQWLMLLAAALLHFHDGVEAMSVIVLNVSRCDKSLPLLQHCLSQLSLTASKCDQLPLAGHCHCNCNTTVAAVVEPDYASGDAAQDAATADDAHHAVGAAALPLLLQAPHMLL